MSNRRILNSYEFLSLNESNGVSKKDIGVIGPLPSGDLVIKYSTKDAPWKRNDSSSSHFFDVGESEIEIPKKCIDVSVSPGYDIITFKTGMNWFKNEENYRSFENLVEDFISHKLASGRKKINPLEEDVNIITDEIGIDADVDQSDQNSDFEIDGSLSNGMEFEFSKSSLDDPIKKLLLYKSREEIHPTIEMKRKGSKFSCKYRTPYGKFESEHDSLSSILKSPIDKYLLSVCIDGKNLEEDQRDLVNHLLTLFKYHTWVKPESGVENVMERYLDESREIKRVMEILKNSIPEKHIEEMYSDARAKFISKK